MRTAAVALVLSASANLASPTDLLAEVSLEALAFAEAETVFPDSDVTFDDYVELAGADFDIDEIDVDADDIDSFAAGFRMWIDEESGEIVLTQLLRLSDEAAASDALAGATESDGLANRRQGPFPGSIAGDVVAEGVPATLVAWRHGVFVVVMGHFGGSGPPVASDTAGLAITHERALTARIGQAPATEPVDGADDSIAYRIGRVIGTLLLPALLIAGLVWFWRRRSRRRPTIPPPPLPPTYAPAAGAQPPAYGMPAPPPVERPPGGAPADATGSH